MSAWIRHRFARRPVIADDERRERELAWQRLAVLRNQLRVIQLRQIKRGRP